MLGILGLGLWMLFTPPSNKQSPPMVRSMEQWTDSNGRKLRPLLQGDHKTTVFLFIMTDCPIANSYAPEVNRIMADYDPKGVAFYIVYVDPHPDTAAVRKHARDYGYRCTALLDPRHTLAQSVGATVTPEAVVVGADQAIVYRGRIDDRVIDFGKIRHRPNRQDLRLALDAVLEGRAVSVARTQCIGCFISSAKSSEFSPEGKGP
jgi:hypothetical protein